MQQTDHQYEVVHNPAENLCIFCGHCQCMYPGKRNQSLFVAAGAGKYTNDRLTIASLYDSSKMLRTKKQTSEPSTLPRFENPNENHSVSSINASSTLNKTSLFGQSINHVNLTF